MDNKIGLKSIGELQDMNFYIPAYQRGYRWNTHQVKDLLDDIQEFINKKKEGFYCIQHLVVRRSICDTKVDNFKAGLEKISNTHDNERTIVEETEKLIYENTQWEVIDGQQRLTTIYVLLSYLKMGNFYELEYKTREESKSFLRDIKSNKKNENIDYYHIVKAYQQIKAWFRSIKTDEDKFLETLLNDVQFIWYESVGEDQIKVFTRLNVGKIALTNAELVKALFLSKSNFKGSNQRVRLQQNEIALEWDKIEYYLHNDEFWLFLHEVGYDKPTRIDFIFDLMVEKNILKLTDQINTIGNDEHRTFRYFYEWFNSHNGKDIDVSLCWGEVKAIFSTFQEWFNDLELYHYVGFLVENKTKVTSILDEWIKTDRTKSQFLKDYIISEIKKKLTHCSALNKQYDINGNPKTQCRPILLLHNIQTVITQNKTLIENCKYKLPIFYKFPFHLFKSETWNVEHIDSNTENPLDNENEQKEWLKHSYEFVSHEVMISKESIEESKKVNVNLKEAMKNFIENQNDQDNELKFDTLWRKVIDNTTSQQHKLNDTEKNQLWNFALLDESTNKGYGNAIFPAKRRILLGKDQGKKIKINDNLEFEESEGAISFIPPCTKNVFLKYYNPLANNLREWDLSDALAYQNNIATTLRKFLKSE